MSNTIIFNGICTLCCLCKSSRFSLGNALTEKKKRRGYVPWPSMHLRINRREEDQSGRQDLNEETEVNLGKFLMKIVAWLKWFYRSLNINLAFIFHKHKTTTS